MQAQAAVTQAASGSLKKITLDTKGRVVGNQAIVAADIINLGGIAAAAHGHSKADIGLGSVDNTADASKSVNYATNANYASTVGLSQFVFLLATNGYQKLPSGLIMQWGSAYLPVVHGQIVYFPIAFPSAVVYVNYSADTNNSSANTNPTVRGITTTQWLLDNHVGTPTTVKWFAIGY